MVPILAVLRTLFDIARWRRGPQDLPASSALVIVLLALYTVASFIQAAMLGWNVRAAAGPVFTEAFMLFGWVWALLAFFGKRARFAQTIAAVLGVWILLMVVDLVLLVAAVPRATMDTWSLLRLLALIVLIGRILMLAIEGGLLTGFAFTMTMLLSIIAVGQLFTPVTG